MQPDPLTTMLTCQGESCDSVRAFRRNVRNSMRGRSTWSTPGWPTGWRTRQRWSEPPNLDSCRRSARKGNLAIHPDQVSALLQMLMEAGQMEEVLIAAGFDQYLFHLASLHHL